MTPLGRALLGAALGAVITLFLHPVARPFLVSEFREYPVQSLADAISIRGDRLPPPTNRANVSVWLILAAEKLQSGIRLKKGELVTLIGLAQRAQRIEPDNAFWPQMQAVFYFWAQQPKQAREQWDRASRCQMWDDQQTRRLLQDKVRLSSVTNASQAWQYGYVFFNRSTAAAEQIKKYAISLIQTSDIAEDKGLVTRYITIRNGSLLRDGSRSLHVGLNGAAFVELATYPKDALGKIGPRRIWIAQTQLTSKLRQLGMIREAERAERDFNANEAWLVLTERFNPDDNVRDLCLGAVALSSFPGAMALSAGLAAIAYLIGRFNQRRLSAMRLFPAYAVGIGALLFAFVVFVSSRSWPAAAIVGLCTAFAAMGPFNPRTRRTDDLGPLFSFVILSIWLIAVITFAVHSLSASTAAHCMLPLLGPAGEYLSEGPMFGAVSAIALSLLFLVVPAWAVVRRYGTPDLLGLALQRLGKVGIGGGLILCVLAGPFTVYADSKISAELQQIVANEPIYYLVK